MGILKIEMEVPDFKDAIELSLTLKKDGKVITTSEFLEKDSEKPIWKQDMPLGPGTLYNVPDHAPVEEIWKQSPPDKFIVGDDPTQKGPYCGDVVPNSISGNFMNINIDEL